MTNHWSNCHVLDLPNRSNIIRTVHEILILAKLKIIDINHANLIYNDLWETSIFRNVDHLIWLEHQIPRFNIKLFFLLHFMYLLNFFGYKVFVFLWIFFLKFSYNLSMQLNLCIEIIFSVVFIRVNNIKKLVFNDIFKKNNTVLKSKNLFQTSLEASA